MTPIACAFLILFLALPSSTSPAQSTEPVTIDWSEGAPIPLEGRANIFQVPPAKQQSLAQGGLKNAISYPVEVTGLLIPLELLNSILDTHQQNPIRRLLLYAFQSLSGLKKFDDFERLLGLVPIPDAAHNIYNIPLPSNEGPAKRLGTSIVDAFGSKGVTFSCAACHFSQLFGVAVPGLTNRFPQANSFFIAGKKGLSVLDPHLTSAMLGLGTSAAQMLTLDKVSMSRVESREPRRDGLDTSLSHVALSLSHRELDGYASPSAHYAAHPREEPLRTQVSDSKPAVWWNVKYKNKWLLDGSVVAGNPIYTNILWNEIGRGTDLHVLEQWFTSNAPQITQLTAAVFAAQPPRFTDFFQASMIDLNSAQRGQALFAENCQSCHGSYEKAWDLPTATDLSAKELLATTRVQYFADTPVLDVGTDPKRAQAMTSLLQLNDLVISKNQGIVIKVQQGYVPPPLEGIWARWPYFHNNSVPSLCAVLTAGKKRPKTYFAGEAINPATDFDFKCNGYPSADKVPSAWRQNPRRKYDTTEAGLGNQGHDEGIFLKNGQEIYSSEQKMDLIEFLKTL